jgi:hypothetical protein
VLNYEVVHSRIDVISRDANLIPSQKGVLGEKLLLRTFTRFFANSLTFFAKLPASLSLVSSRVPSFIRPASSLVYAGLAM